MAAESTVAVAHGNGRGRGQEDTRGGQFFRPSVDIYEESEKLVVVADMPGVKSHELDVKFEDGLLTIHGHVAPRSQKRCAVRTPSLASATSFAPSG